MTPEANGLEPLPEGVDIKLTPPVQHEIHLADGIYVRQIVIRNAGSMLPQHEHPYDHSTMIAKGSVFVWKNGSLLGRYKAPAGLFIEAGAAHMFMALEDDTVVYCLHNLLDGRAAAFLAGHGVEAE